MQDQEQLQETIDHARLERDLRQVVDVILVLLPPIPPWLTKLVGRSLDLRETGYQSSSAISALPDPDLCLVLDRLIEEFAIVRGRLRPEEATPDSPEEREAWRKVLVELNTGR